MVISGASVVVTVVVTLDEVTDVVVVVTVAVSVVVILFLPFPNLKLSFISLALFARASMAEASPP
jgi:hypothetical protein